MSDEKLELDPKEVIKTLRRQRAVHKGKITKYLNKLSELHNDKTLTYSYCKKQIEEIENELDLVKSFDTRINNVMNDYEFDSLEATMYNAELDSQAQYVIDTGISLDKYEGYINNSETSGMISAEKVVDMMSKFNFNEGKPPPLECGTFSGKEKDKFAFNTFLNQFNNVIGYKKNLSDASKQTYLYGYLRDYALKVVKHLPISDTNYHVALQMLKQEFLDVNYITDETFRQILKASPSEDYDHEFSSVKLYLNEIKSYLYDLKSHGIDLLEEDSAGNKFVSHVVFNKLPVVVRREFVHKLDDNYPKINDVLSNYHEILKTLIKTLPAKKKNYSRPAYKINTNNNRFSPKTQGPEEKRATVQNFKAMTTKSVRCKLCGSDDHSLGKCETFRSYNDRVARLKELSMCSKCAGSGHTDDQCFGNQNKLKFECRLCKRKEHITPLCPSTKSSSVTGAISKTNVSLCYAQRSFDSSHILPTMTLFLKNGLKSRKVRCLIDCGSQRSYISESVVKDLCHDVNQLFDLECDVSTYIGQNTKEFKQMSTGVKINGRLYFIPLLVDKNFNISYEVPGLSLVVHNFKQNKIGLLDEAFHNNGNHDLIAVDMLMGIDIIQYMLPSQHQRILGGTCLVINNKVAPIGNVFSFLNKEQGREVRSSIQASKNVNCLDEKTKTMINLIMDPLKSYFNPLENILEDSEVDNGLEYLFSLESIGIKKDDKELVSFDKEQIEKFKDGIEFKDGYYNVELPWYPDKVDLVPSNYFVALRVLDRTMEHLRKKGLTEKYQEVFDNQLRDGIIEEIKVHPNDYANYIWIPHRPVIRMAEQVTTKVRPVFNCSLKTNKELPSLNEAAYPGIDLMGSILKLLFYFRTNKLVMLSDIKQAFLMVKLKKEIDKNRFCFFWKRGDKLVTYRYNSIVFGYTSSPFILNYVMKHHAEKFSDDKCKEILSNNFYVDNLLITGNNVDEMKTLYDLSYERMKEGGFILRSWNSNSDELRKQMSHDKRLVEHTCPEDKVLGYRYNVNCDTLSVAPCEINPEADTKRKVLSQTSKVFDPLNLTLPVTIRGRILMRKIWKLKVEWDDKLPPDICTEMKILSKDLEMLSQIQFPRQALNEQSSYGLHIFCDSSAESYGFVAYAVDEKNKGSMLFAKSKLAPLNKRNEHSIPTLELMGVILAYKCLPNILEAYNNIQFQFVNVCVDAQVVLNWLITKETKVKSKFVRNRVLEVDGLNKEIANRFRLPILYHYVNTNDNPADLTTKGLTYSKYLKKLKFWLEGPEWITNNFENWPHFPLLSISPNHKHQISTACTMQPNKVNTGILNINKFSSFDSLLKATRRLYVFLSKLKGCDATVKAIEYWVKIAQQEYFSKEIKFLTENTVNANVNDKKVPSLVMNLNLFLDNKGILRSRGRISKCLYFDYNVHNPILLPKEHRFTSLFINYCHLKVQHLGIGTTLNYLREEGYWIPKGRAAVKTELSNCITCRKYNALAFKYPKFTEMPKHHMNLVKPFQHVGVDYTGHFWVQDELSGKSTKMFILVFTCLNIRAVHFELLPDMSTKNFILAFQRFSNIYSIPHYLYSDNAKQFLKGGSILEQSLQSEEFQLELEKCNIKHIKIPLYSAWVGAAWERLIRVLKSCLYKVIGRSRLTYFELLTTLSNIQLAINSRPLTYRSSTDKLEFITPNSFIRLHGNSSLILRGDDSNVWVDDTSQPNLEKTVQMQEEIVENFKKLWYESYLLSLREHSRNLYRSKWENRIKVGDIVLIKAINKPRPFWMMGKVLEVIIGYDGSIRSVKLKQGNGAIEYHSICNLYPMEISITHAVRDQNVGNISVVPDAEDNSDNKLESSQTDSQVSVRPKRKATERFHRILKDKIGDL